MKSGILVIHKKSGITSREVVDHVCQKFHTKHVGHTGTLDPIATGVLVVAIGDGCKMIELLTSATKVYQAEILVGMKTDTLDITGQVEKTESIDHLEEETIDQVFANFPRKYVQEVPKYSAIHVKGKRLYEYARNQIEVSLPKREVEILSLKRVGKIQKENSYYTFSIQVEVSKGTYIRSLIRDIGKQLGIDCTMKSLIRIKQGDFSIDQAILEEEMEESKIIPILEAFPSYPRIVVDEITKRKVQNGMVFALDTEEPMVFLVDSNQELLAIYQRYEKDPTKMKPYRVFAINQEERKK